MQTIKSVLYEVIHRNRKTVAQIADETGISSNYLYRAGLPLEQSGVRFPIEYLIPLMRATDNYKLLKHLANTCGFVIVKVPKVTPLKGDKHSIISEYQTITSKASGYLIKFLEDPNQENFELAINNLDEVMECSTRTKMYIKKEAEGQFEFNFGVV